MIGLVIGGLALARPVTSGSLAPLMGLAVGLVAALKRWVECGCRHGRPRTGNGVVGGGAAAFVLGLIAVPIGGLLSHAAVASHCSRATDVNFMSDRVAPAASFEPYHRRLRGGACNRRMWTRFPHLLVEARP